MPGGWDLNRQWKKDGFCSCFRYVIVSQELRRRLKRYEELYFENAEIVGNEKFMLLIA